MAVITRPVQAELIQALSGRYPHLKGRIPAFVNDICSHPLFEQHPEFAQNISFFVETANALAEQKKGNAEFFDRMQKFAGQSKDPNSIFSTYVAKKWSELVGETKGVQEAVAELPITRPPATPPTTEAPVEPARQAPAPALQEAAAKKQAPGPGAAAVFEGLLSLPPSQTTPQAPSLFKGSLPPAKETAGETREVDTAQDLKKIDDLLKRTAQLTQSGIVGGIQAGMLAVRLNIWKKELEEGGEMPYPPGSLQKFEESLESLEQTAYLDGRIRRYLELLAARPDDCRVHLMLGTLFREKGDVDKAIEYYEAALGLEPERNSIWLDLAYAYKEKGDLEKAAKYIREVFWRVKSAEESFSKAQASMRHLYTKSDS